MAVDARQMLEQLRTEAPEQDARSVLEQLRAEPEKEGPDFIQRIGARLSERVEQVNATLEEFSKGKPLDPKGMSTLSANIQILGKGVAGSVLDIAGETISTGATQVADGISLLVPDELEEEVKQGVKDAWDWLANSFIGKEIEGAIVSGVDAYQTLKQKFPQEAKTLESLVNIGLVFAPAKIKVQSEPSMLGQTAEALEKSIVTSKKKAAEKLLKPPENRKLRIKQISQEVEKGVGPFKRGVVQPTKRELESIDVVAKIPGVSSTKSELGNHIAIRNFNKKEAIKLDSALSKIKEPLTNEASFKNIDDIVNTALREDPEITKNLAVSVKRVVSKAKEFIKSNPPTAKGVFDARKEFDKWAEKTLGPKVLDPDVTQRALNKAVLDVRRSMNDTVAAHAKSVQVKRMLKEQNIMWESMDIVAEKYAVKSRFAIGRLIHNSASVITTRQKVLQTGALVMGTTILGAATVLAPYATGVFVAGSALGISIFAGRAVLSKKMRKGLIELIKLADKAIGTSKNASMIKQLRLDRAAVVELLKSTEEEDNGK